MDSLINTIKDWPVIVQGALGSGLFWLILLVGNKLQSALSEKYSSHSTKSRINWLRNEQCKHGAVLSEKLSEKNFWTTALIYRASRHVIRALMWLSMGLVFQSFFMPIGIVGFIGALHYLFKAYDVVSPVHKDNFTVDSLKEIHEELDKLNKKET
ncbi:hypothetical protein [Vibrio diabolicus]|uniref:hypothetical protein n=1 Tax=Vibrio diabolicus TaxID=50719 RepID=UPI00294154F0|nr:hypothetical protein [Vibrio diabolicus]MDV5033002.1 hypothetical protein [Vibrio diabolicus]